MTSKSISDGSSLFRSQRALYTVIGAIAGCFFPAGALLIDAFLHDFQYSLFVLPLRNPIHFVIFSAPLVMGFMARLAGIREDRIRGQQERLEEAHKNLTNRAGEMRDIMRNIREGILTINRDYSINQEYSDFLEDIFAASSLSGRQFLDLIYAAHKTDERKALAEYLDILFTNQTTSEAVLKELNPIKHFELARYETRGEVRVRYLLFDFVRIVIQGALDKVMVIVQDRTEEVVREKQRVQEQMEHSEELERIASLINVPVEDINRLVLKSESLIAIMEGFFKEAGAEHAQVRTRLAEILADLHSLKGESRLYRLASLATIIHEIEEKIRTFQSHDLEATDEQDLNLKMDIMFSVSRYKLYVGEIKDTRDRLFERAREQQQHTVGMHPLMEELMPRLIEFHRELGSMIEALPEHGERSVPKSNGDWTGALNDLLRESVAELHDRGEIRRIHPLQVDSELASENMASLSALRPAIIHLLQNALVHGIETPEERQSAGKSSEGNIRLLLRRVDDTYRITVEDDGAGIDLERIKAVLRRQKHPDADQLDQLQINDAIRIIFHSGFSSAENVSTVAGRGIGMDAVRRLVRQYHGKISVTNRPGRGLAVALIIPTEAIGKQGAADESVNN